MTFFRSVTSRLILSYCLLLALLGGAFLFFTVVSFQHYTRQTINETLDVRTHEIWNIAQGLLDQPGRLREVVDRRFAPESQDRFIRIRSGDHVIYSSGDPTDQDFDPASIPLQTPIPQPHAMMIGDLILYTASFDGLSGRKIVIETGQSYRFAKTVQERLATSLFVGLPVLLLMAAAAGVFLMRRALTPVETMINAAEAYSFNDAQKRLPLLGTEPRIEALGLALNRMLDRLDGAYSHVSRFSADAAHELRTPLTIIRGELELAMNQPRSVEEIERALGNALEEMTRLSGIVDSLITLSRMESMWGKRAHSVVDLDGLATEVIEQIRLMAVEKGITLEKTLGESAAVAGDRDRLKQVLVNLVDNAIKYTPQNGKVTVTVGAVADHAFMEVEDSGIGIDPSHHEKVFDRFYRVAPDRGESGAGLGLAIVKSICHAHGGTIGLRSAPEIGSCFRVELPLLLESGIAGTGPENRLAAAGVAAARSFADR